MTTVEFRKAVREAFFSPEQVGILLARITIHEADRFRLTTPYYIDIGTGKGVILQHLPKDRRLGIDKFLRDVPSTLKKDVVRGDINSLASFVNKKVNSDEIVAVSNPPFEMIEKLCNQLFATPKAKILVMLVPLKRMQTHFLSKLLKGKGMELFYQTYIGKIKFEIIGAD